MTDEEQAAKFWKDFENETGEKVEARAIGEFFDAGDMGPSYWGILVLTDKSFRFRHMPSQNWLSALFRRADKSSDPKEAIEIKIAREDIVSLVTPPRGFFGRLFAPPFPHFTINVKAVGDEGEPKSYRFSVDPSKGFLNSLTTAFTA